MSDQRLTKQQIVINWVNDNISHHIYRAGDRLPSIRSAAKKLDVSIFTVTQAYEKLVATGVLEAKKGSGYFVCYQRKSPSLNKKNSIDHHLVDSTWMMHHLINKPTKLKAPGSGVLPKSYLFYERLPAISKQVINKIHQFIYQTTDIQGYKPLREYYSLKLNQFGVVVNPDELITSSSVSLSLSFITKYLVSAGDTVVVDNPCWFWLMGNLQNQGLNVIGIDRDHNGPNIEQLTYCFKYKNAKAYLTNSALQNPTSFGISPSIAYKVISLLHQHDAYLIEDDIYLFLEHQNSNQNGYKKVSFRYASLDRERVFYITGISKILGANWHQSIICSPPNHTENIIKAKALNQVSNSELQERLIYSILTDSSFRKHQIQIINQLINDHERLKKLLPKYGFKYPDHTQQGIFLWLETQCNSTELALAAKKEGFLIAPGELFYSHQKPSTHIRINVALTDELFIKWLSDYRTSQNN